MPNPHRQPNRTTTSATNGMPITLENFAAASKSEVANERSWRGNQYPVAFELAGKLGASAAPSRMRAARMPRNPLAKAVAIDATDQRNVLNRLTKVTPKRSRIMPVGICIRA